jgi:hypothetical protein
MQVLVGTTVEGPVVGQGLYIKWSLISLMILCHFKKKNS